MSIFELKAELHRLVDEMDDEAQLQIWLDLLSGSVQPDNKEAGLPSE